MLIVVDTLRRDHIGTYGGSLATPNLDALAKQGQVFTRAYASFHQTSMSMGALFTGRTPSIESEDPSHPLPWNGSTWCGMARFARPGSYAAGRTRCIPDSIETVGEALRDAGYWTIGIASSELLFRPAGFDAGFDDWTELGRTPGPGIRAVPIWVPEKGGLASASKEEGVKSRVARMWHLVSGTAVNHAARKALSHRKSDRVFLYVHYMDVHDYEFMRLPYQETVPGTDRAIGELLDSMRTEGLLDDAVVIVTSDHGENLGERHGVRGGAYHRGNPSYDEVLEIPLIISPPVPALRGRENEIVRSADLHAWIREIAGAPVPEATPILEPDELFVSELTFRTFRKGRWKSAIRRRDGVAHLFDLENDPAETRDVAGLHPEVTRDHLARVSEFAGPLAGSHGLKGELSPEDERRLRLLGYLDE